MSVNRYLTELASAAIVRDNEEQSIRRSIAVLESRLRDHFGPQRLDSLLFGSYSRGTILPRSMDPESDVDYMVVFADDGVQPQTHLDRVRRFAEKYYVRSEIAQSHPTVALELNHIRFELVPAIKSWFGGIQIPAKASGYQSWLATDPKSFNDILTSANRANGNLIKPLCRLLKYWNATERYPFDSFGLEKQIVEQGFGLIGLVTPGLLREYFFQAVDSLEPGWTAPQRKREALRRLKRLSSLARSQERSGNVLEAEDTIRLVLPPSGR